MNVKSFEAKRTDSPMKRKTGLMPHEQRTRHFFLIRTKYLHKKKKKTYNTFKTKSNNWARKGATGCIYWWIVEYCS